MCNNKTVPGNTLYVDVLIIIEYSRILLPTLCDKCYGRTRCRERERLRQRETESGRERERERESDGTRERERERERGKEREIGDHTE